MNNLGVHVNNRKIYKAVSRLSDGRYYLYKLIFVLSILVGIIIYIISIKGIAISIIDKSPMIVLCLIFMANAFAIPIIGYVKQRKYNILKQKITQIYKLGRGFYVEEVLHILKKNPKYKVVAAYDWIFIKPDFMSAVYDVAWIYKKVVNHVVNKQFFSITYETERHEELYWVIHTAYGEVAEIQMEEKEIEKMIRHIVKYNPMLLIGYTQKNYDLYEFILKQHKNIAKQ